MLRIVTRITTALTENKNTIGADKQKKKRTETVHLRFAFAAYKYKAKQYSTISSRKNKRF